VSVYLRLRDQFPNSLLLESSDYHASRNSFSYICCNPIASIRVEKETVTEKFPDGSELETRITANMDLPEKIHQFAQKFEVEDTGFKFINNGLFGYIAYDGVKYFEKVSLEKKAEDLKIPELFYAIYQNIIAINHFNNEAYIFDHSYGSRNNIEQIAQLLKAQNIATY